MNTARCFLLVSTLLLLQPMHAFQMPQRSSTSHLQSFRRQHYQSSSSYSTFLHNPDRKRQLSGHSNDIISSSNNNINNNANDLLLRESSNNSIPIPPLFQVMAASFLLSSTLLLSAPQSANAALGAAGGAVTSPAIVDSITLDEWINLPAKKQRQYEGGFLSCKTVVVDGNDIDFASGPGADPVSRGVKKWFQTKNQELQKKRKRVCKPVNLGDELLNEIDEMAKENPDKEEQFKLGAQNLMAMERLLGRKAMEKKLSMQPDYINFGCAFLASCVSTLIVHPLDTLKVRLISGKGGEAEDDDDSYSALSEDTDGGAGAFLKSLSGLYDGIGANIAKEAPASALYLGIYESARTYLDTVPFFQEHILLNYLLAGSIGELVGSASRSPAEAVKTRIQTGDYDMKGAINNVFFTPEGRKNTFDAWFAGVFRDIPHGSIQIAVFEFSKILIVNSAADIDVNTLLSEALLGGFGGGLGAFVSTPSDVVVVNVMTSMNDEGDTKSAKDILVNIWNEDGVKGLFSGFAERVSYWAIAVGIFLSVYCSLRQYSLTLM